MCGSSPARAESPQSGGSHLHQSSGAQVTGFQLSIFEKMNKVDAMTRKMVSSMDIKKITSLPNRIIRNWKLGLDITQQALQHVQRQHARSPLTMEQRDELCSKKLLKKWLTFSLKQRSFLANKIFPQGPRVTVYKLRQLYASNDIKLRKLHISADKTPNQLNRIQMEQQSRLPTVIKLMKQKRRIVFLDEAIFTGRTMLQKVWADDTATATISKRKLSFNAVAVAAAIDLRGFVVAMVTSDMSIKLPTLTNLLNTIRDYYNKGKTYIFVDNLSLHHSSAITELTKKNNQVLLFNASYSSELNPIERLWAHAKRLFAREIVESSDFKSQEEVKAFVQKAILSVPPSYLQKHVDRCLKRMEHRLVIIKQSMADSKMKASDGARSNNTSPVKTRSADRTPTPSKNNQPGQPSNPFKLFDLPDLHKPTSSVTSKPPASTNATNLSSFRKMEPISVTNQRIQSQSHPVPVSQIVNYTGSKKKLYRSLVIKGKLFLPPYRQCTVDFIRQILTGDKSFFRCDDVPIIQVQRIANLSMKTVIDQVYDIPAVRAYLPDFDKDVVKRMNRDFLFHIVNRLDPDFFTKAIAHIEAQAISQRPPARQQTLAIQPELLQILIQGQSSSDQRMSRASGRVLSSLLGATKKRKLRDVTGGHDIDTTFDTTALKRLKKD